MLGHDLTQGRIFSRPAILLIAALFAAVLFLSSPSAGGLFAPAQWHSSSSAPSLAARLETSEMLWKASVEQRYALYQHYGGPDAVAWPSSSPLPYYTLWSFFPPTFNCPFSLRRLGTIMDGGRWTCGVERLAAASDCIVYSIGQLGESSYEAELLSTTRCKVYGYDPHSTSFGPEVHGHTRMKARSFFFPYEIGSRDDHTAQPPVWTLRQLMKAHGHNFIDILRIDIESNEFQLLADIVKDYRSRDEPLPFGQLTVEIHALGRSVKSMMEWWGALEAAGLRPFMSETNLVFANMARLSEPPALSEYSFINIRGDHKLLRA